MLWPEKNSTRNLITKLKISCGSKIIIGKIIGKLQNLMPVKNGGRNSVNYLCKFDFYIYSY